MDKKMKRSIATVADVEMLKGGFSRLVDTYTTYRQRRCTEPQSGDQSAQSAEIFSRCSF